MLARFRGTWMVFNGEVTQSNGQFPTGMGRYGPEMNAQWCVYIYICMRVYICTYVLESIIDNRFV